MTSRMAVVMEARISPSMASKAASESSAGCSMYMRPAWKVTPGGAMRLKSCSTTVLVEGTMTPSFARQPTTSGTEALEVAQDIGRAHDVGVFRVHVEERGFVGTGRPVADALARHDDAVPARAGVHHARPHAAGRGTTGNDQRVAPEGCQEALERRAEEGRCHLLDDDVVTRVGGDAAVDLDGLAAFLEQLEERHLDAEEACVEPVGAVLGHRVDDGRAGGPGGGQERGRLVHGIAHAAAAQIGRVGAAVEEVHHEHRGTAAEADAAAELLLAIYVELVGHRRPAYFFSLKPGRG